MALRVWLPLNGNLENQGLSDIALTNNGATIDNNGKIGKCYKFTTSKSLISIDFARNSISYASWIYITPSDIQALINNQTYDSSYNTSGGDIIGRNSYGGLSIRWQTNNLTSNKNLTNIYLYGALRNYDLAETSSTSVYANTTKYNLKFNTWTHVALIWDKENKELSLYINGILFNSTILSKSPEIGARNTVVTAGLNQNTWDGGNGRSLSIPIKYNDVRLYDHCLSPKEVKEISKGLCLHYPLNNIYNCQPNKYSSPYCDGYMSNTGGFTRTALTNERGYNYKMTYTGTGNNAWKSLCVPNYSFTVGKKYYYSVKIRCNKWTGDSLYLRASRSNNDWVTNSVLVCSSGKADRQWHEYYTYQTVNKTYDRSGSTVTCNPVLEFYTGNCAINGFVYDFDFDIKDVQVIESDQYVPFQEGQWNTNIVSDCSGFRNDGIKSGTLIYNSNSPRYSSSYKFNTGVDYIKSAFTLSMSELSCSFWVKPNSSNGEYSIIASNYSNPSSGFWLAINTEGSGVWFFNGTYVKGTPVLTNNVWHHCVFTFKNGIGTWYVNGTSVVSTNISSRGTSLNINNLTVGNSYTGTSWNTKNYGNISDFRVYATALSAADVLELYEVCGAIDSHYNSYVYEYITDDSNEYLNSQGISGISDLEETDENTRWLSTGKIESNNFYEI